MNYLHVIVRTTKNKFNQIRSKDINLENGKIFESFKDNIIASEY